MKLCRVCNYKLIPFFSMGKIPLVNSFLKKVDITNEKKYDLTVGFCENCYMVQLTETIQPKDLFTNYIYLSGTSNVFIEHSKKMATNLRQKLDLKKNSFVIEVASNDGTQLKFFRKIGMRTLGVDPAKNIAKIANENGIETIPNFFNFRFSRYLLKKRGNKADLIFGANVLAHVPEIVDFLKGVKFLLSENGSAVFEFPYLKGLLENKFDIIYHEHVFYYSLIALRNLFSKADLLIYDVDFTPMQGGSLLIYTGHPDKHVITNRVKNLIQVEVDNNYHKISTYIRMGENVEKLRNDILRLVTSIKNKKKSIVAYSAPAKGMVLVNYFGLGKNIFDYVVDKAKGKQGLYTPGTRMMIYPIEKIFTDRPDYVMILCWNLADEIMKQLNDYHQKGGKFIIPVPSVNIL